MSRRKKGNHPVIRPHESPAIAENKTGKKVDEFKWTRREVHVAFVTGLFSAGAWVWERFWPSSRNYRSDLNVTAIETILSDSRLLSVSVTNNGNDPAADVAVVIESYYPFVKLDEAACREHTHVIPPQKFDLNVEDRRLTIALDGKIGPRQNVLIFADRLGAYQDKPALFQCTVTYDQGQAEVTSSVMPLYGKSSGDYIEAAKEALGNKAPGDPH